MENVKYIPGDLVKVDEEVCTVEAMDRSRSEFDLLDEDNFWHVAWINEITPIPLTPAILEDNGWEKVHQEPVNCCNKYKKFRNVDLTYNIQTKTFCFEIFNIAGAVVVRLPYVHTLQHLLFGLGLNNKLKI